MSMSLIPPKSGIAGQGKVDVGTTAAALGSGQCSAVAVKAASGNAGVVYVGNSTVTDGDGYPLAAGESETFFVSDLSAIYVIAADANQDAYYIATTRL